MRVVNGNNFPLSDEEEDDEDQSDLTVTPKKKNTQHLKKSPGEPKKMGTFDAKNQEEYAPPVIALSCLKCKKEMQVDPKGKTRSDLTSRDLIPASLTSTFSDTFVPDDIDRIQHGPLTLR